MAVTYHVIPVPDGRTAEEAWEDIRLLGCLSGDVHADDKDCEWAVVKVVTDDEAPV